MHFVAGSRNPWLQVRERRQAQGYVFRLTGQLLTKSGAAITGATVYLYDFMSNALVATTTSDGGGNYQFNPPTNGPYWTRFYLAGAPELFGTSGKLIPS